MAPVQKLQFTTLDVFTQERYSGNQLAVVRVPPSSELTQKQKQAIAKEFNYSETVILHENEEGDDRPEWTINIFVTNAEIPFAGHPTIGTACLIASAMKGGNDQTRREGVLKTKAGPVSFSYCPSENEAELAIPHDVLVHPVSFTQELAEQHGIPPQVVKSMTEACPAAPIVSIVKGMTFCLLELASLDDLGLLEPNLKEANNIEGLNKEWQGLVGMMFFVRQGKGADGESKLRTRMMIGSLEDAATGSASAALAAYLAVHDPKREDTQKGVYHVTFEQGVEMGRRSVIMVEVQGDHASKKIEKVILKGSAVEVMEGSLIVPSA